MARTQDLNLVVNLSKKINPTSSLTANSMNIEIQTEGKNECKLEAKNKSALKKNNKTSRYIPIDIKQALFKRAQGCCEYVNEQGGRCTNRFQLEIDHAVIPFSQGGDHSMENLLLSCSNHNSYRANKMGIGYETICQFTY